MEGGAPRGGPARSPTGDAPLPGLILCFTLTLLVDAFVCFVGFRNIRVIYFIVDDNSDGMF